MADDRPLQGRTLAEIDPGSERYLAEHYLRWVAEQCRYGLFAAEDNETAYERKDWDRFWYSLQSLLTAAANVSKVLWPARRRREDWVTDRGERLRELLGIGEDSPLGERSLRHLRNHLEHFDERLDEWIVTDERHNIADLVIGPAHAVVVQGAPPQTYVRRFDPDRRELVFWQRAYPLLPVVDELRRVSGLIGPHGQLPTA